MYDSFIQFCNFRPLTCNVEHQQQPKPLEKEIATQSSILAWRIHGQTSLGGYSPWGRKRVGHDLVTQQQQPKHP